MNVSTKSSPIESLSQGLLNEFSSVRELEEKLEQIEESQATLLSTVVELKDYYASNEELLEVKLMVSA
jgi:uncharacterized protein (DUF3084 family)